MTNSQAELEHINLQRKKHSRLNYTVLKELAIIEHQIPDLIELKSGVVRDDIYRLDPDRKDPQTAKKVYRNIECISKLEGVYTAICELRKAVGEVDLSEDDKKPPANY